MRLKPSHIYLVLIAVLVTVSYSFAQESGSPVLEGMEAEKQSSGGEIIIYTDGEGSVQRVQPTTVAPSVTPNTTQPTTQRESYTNNNKTNTVQAKPKSTQQKQAEEAEAKPEDSVLGFNFLYYIFQKYKMSDIVD